MDRAQGASRTWLYVGGGCGIFGLGVGIAMCAGLVAIGGGNEGGARLTNNMERYALDYIARERLLEPDERVIAYFDATIDLDGTEAAIVTDRRVLYHRASMGNTSIALADIEAIENVSDPMGENITVRARDGTSILIVIPLWNGGEVFVGELRAAHRRASGGG